MNKQWKTRVIPIVFAWVCLTFPSAQQLSVAINALEPSIVTEDQVSSSKVANDGNGFDWIYESYYYASNGQIAQEKYIAAHLALKGITATPCS